MHSSKDHHPVRRRRLAGSFGSPSAPAETSEPAARLPRLLVIAFTAVFAGSLAGALVAPAAGREHGPDAPARGTIGSLANPVGSDPFRPARSYRGDFPDPTILRARNRWFAYATTVEGLNLPVLTSRDLRTWTPKRANGRRGTWRNDAMRRAARWAQTQQWRRGRHRPARFFSTTWAPSVARIGGRFVLAYATRPAGQQAAGDRLCISTATSKRPDGPFVDRSWSPLVCPPDRGAIDPQLFTDPSGAHWLLWKTEQRAGLPAQLYSQQLDGSGQEFAPGSAPTMLLQTQDPWEGGLIENPSMSVYAGRYYLFYSANDYGSAGYATGYAQCAGPAGPCLRAAPAPLLASGADYAGPGGAMSFVDGAGRLRLAYAAWSAGNTGYPLNPGCRRAPPGCAQRRLHLATLAVVPDGSLVVTDRG